jgi:exodeoxyribonuclease III
VLDWLRDNPIDVLCLQETKQEDIKSAYDEIQAAGYNAIHSGQKTYNGVAILSTHNMIDVATNRVMQTNWCWWLTLNRMRFVCLAW